MQPLTPTPALIHAETLAEREGKVLEENLLPVASRAGGKSRHKKNLPCAFRAGEIGGNWGKLAPMREMGGKILFDNGVI